MGSSSSSLNKSPIRTDSMITPESPMMTTLKPEKNDAVLLTSPSSNKTFESSRKSTSIPAVSPTTANHNTTPVKSRWSFSSSKKSFGSKDETFFDSQQWLQSDSDDDFHSVNGDFTPSRGNTPKSSFSDRIPRINNLMKSPLGSSPAAQKPRRKKLGELFRDSIREEREESSEAGSSSAVSTPYLSNANSGEFNNSAIEKEEKKKSNWQHQRCLPGFSSCGGSFMERRKKMNSGNATLPVK